MYAGPSAVLATISDVSPAWAAAITSLTLNLVKTNGQQLSQLLYVTSVYAAGLECS